MQETDLEARVALTRAIIAILDEWGIRDADQLVLLALPSGTRVRAIRKYRENTPFPESEEIMERLEHIIGIADALRTTYPRNARMAAQWMISPHKRFDGQSPLSVMINNGLKGLLSVRAQLDCAFAWDHTA